MGLSNADVLGHKVWRHWPGTGSCSMLVIVNSKVGHLFKNISMIGRTIAVDLYRRNSISLRVIGWHGMHGTDTVAGICELRASIAKRRTDADIIVVADAHIDYLPTLETDPYAHEAGRYLHHAEGRKNLAALCDVKGMRVHTAENIRGNANNVLDYLSAVSPITRYPAGQMAGKPSVLDLCLASNEIDILGVGSWNVLPSDHACMFWSFKCSVAPPPKLRPGNWRCSDMTQAIEAGKTLPLQNCTSFLHVQTLCKEVQVNWKCMKTRHKRHSEREPPLIKNLRQALRTLPVSDFVARKQ